MLSQLYIKNIAVIKEAGIDFKEGLNVFTGETGAGKSILIGAINAVLGGRVSRDLIRTGETKAFVSALFTNVRGETRAFVEELGYPVGEDEALLITREISAGNKNTCRINGRPANLLTLKETATRLIDIHGQHDNNKLLSPEYHMDFIDQYGELSAAVEQYRHVYGEAVAVKRQLDSMEMDEGEKARLVDLLTYQIQEIEQAELGEDEEEDLLAKRRRIKNSEKILESLAAAQEALDGGEEFTGAVELVDNAASELSSVTEYVPEMEEAAEKIQGMSYELAEYLSDIKEYLDQMDYNPAQLDEIEDRLDEIRSLKRKYGQTYEDIMAFYERAAKQLESIQFSKEKVDKLTAQLTAKTKEAQRLAKELSEARIKAGNGFISRVQEELAYLDMPSVRLQLSNKRHKLSSKGIDDLEFLISTNQGEPPKPLAKIASGGELSRIMLAIKNVLSGQENVDTMIFDEIDTGVSGRAAQKIGRKLKDVSHDKQVICVTHLAQIASFADGHLLIQKEAGEDGRTYTRVFPLERDGKIRELARIISGENITEATLKTAEEMLDYGAGKPAAGS